MPLVIPKTGPPQFVRTEEVLAEILGHDNFDGEPWAVGDRIIFEDGTESHIEREQGELFYVWPDPTPADLAEVTRTVGLDQVGSWEQFFRHFDGNTKRKGCAASILILLAGHAVVVGLTF